MTRYNIQDIEKSVVSYIKTQKAPVTYETVARRLGIKRKVMKYVFKSNTDVFKETKRYTCAKRSVYTL